MSQSGRWVWSGDLVGAGEIARRLHYSTTMIYHLTTYGDRLKNKPFPQPVVVIGRTKIWEWPAVAAWAEGRVMRKP